LRTDDPTQFHAILDELQSYDDQLKAFGLRERDLDRRMPAGRVVRFLLLEGLRATVLAPLALVGVLCFAPPYWLTWALARHAPDLQSRATWQVVGGVMVYGIWIATLATASGLWWGANTGLGMAAGLPPLAFVGLAAFEREASVLNLVRAFLASRQTPLRARASLKRQRASIVTVLDRVKEWLDAQEPADDQSSARPKSNFGG